MKQEGFGCVPKGSSNISLLLILTTFLGTASASPQFQNWFRQRCGPTGQSIWLYEGGLFDPLTGEQLAHVEGLETVQAVPQNQDSIESNTNVASLVIQKSLQDPQAHYQDSATLLSRKIFIYRSKSNPQQVLDKVKLRPYSPERKVPLDQAVSVYATANTFIEQSPNQWIVHGEWPDGRTVWNQATISIKNDPQSTSPTSLEFQVHVRPRLAKSRKVPDLTLSPTSCLPKTPSQNQTAVTSPPRSALFSMGPSQAEKLSTGARETYQYEWKASQSSLLLGSKKHQNRGSFWSRLPGKRAPRMKHAVADSDQKESCTVRYTRYGEGPVWYGPNRMCTLELKGKRVSPSALPSHITSWCQRHGWNIGKTYNLPHKAELLKDFRQGDDFVHMRQILGCDSANNNEATSQRSKILRTALSWGRRVQQATSLGLTPPDPNKL